MIEEGEIRRLIEEAMPGARVDIEDLRGEGDHYAVTVESAQFAGKSRVDQHRMVFSALQGRVGCVVRSFSLTTRLPGAKG